MRNANEVVKQASRDVDAAEDRLRELQQEHRQLTQQLEAATAAATSTPREQAAEYAANATATQLTATQRDELRRRCRVVEQAVRIQSDTFEARQRDWRNAFADAKLPQHRALGGKIQSTVQALLKSLEAEAEFRQQLAREIEIGLFPVGRLQALGDFELEAAARRWLLAKQDYLS